MKTVYRIGRFAVAVLSAGTLLTGCSTMSHNQVNRLIQKKERIAYMQGVKAGQEMEKSKMESIGIREKEVGARIVGGVYIPAHKEYVIADNNNTYTGKSANNVTEENTISIQAIMPQQEHKSSNSSQHKTPRKKHSKEFAKLPKVNTFGETVSPLRPAPKVNVNEQAKLFENLVNNYNFQEAGNLYRNVISYLDMSKVKDKYDYYMALGKYLMVQNSYKHAYDVYLKAYLLAKGNKKKLSALKDMLTAAKIYGDKELIFTSYINLGDFYLNAMHDKINALENYYHALKIKSTPAVNLRIANILQGLGKEQLAKAFTLKAYIMGEKNGE